MINEYENITLCLAYWDDFCVRLKVVRVIERQRMDAW